MKLTPKGTLKETIGNPSTFMRLVADAVEEFKDLPNFHFNMCTYGKPDRYDDSVCFGCIATCALFHLVDEKPTKDNIKKRTHPTNGFVYDEVRIFEETVDWIRTGTKTRLFNYFDLSYYDTPSDIRSFSIYSVFGVPSDRQLDKTVSSYREWAIILEKHGY